MFDEMDEEKEVVTEEMQEIINKLAFADIVFKNANVEEKYESIKGMNFSMLIMEYATSKDYIRRLIAKYEMARRVETGESGCFV